MKFLITGFKSPENKSNASDILVTSLINDFPQSLSDAPCEVILKVVRDDTHTIKEELLELLHTYEPACCIFTGQAPNRNNITLENIATNYRYLGAPSSIEKPPEGGKVEAQGPAGYFSSLPNMQGIINKLKENGIPAAVSHHGGNSLCNQILYHGLHYAEESKKSTKCGFVHIPALPEQVITQWPQAPFMPLDMSRKAVAITVKSIIEHE